MIIKTDSNVTVCERCKAKNEVDGIQVDIRASDELLCNECWLASKHCDVIEEVEEDDNDDMDSECRDTIEPYLLCEEGFNAHDEELYQVEHDRDVEQSDTLPDTDTLLEKIRTLYSEDTVIHHQEKEPVNMVIKNDKENEDKCVKCRRKVLNGIRCTICKKAWHWKCGGVTKESTTAAIIRDQNWECQLCRSTEKNCMSCKIYSKEITCLKKNIIELEDNLKNLNQELKICSERAEDLEDRLCREKKLRKQVERDLNELKEQVESDSTSSSDESSHTDEEETDYDTRKSRTKAKHPTSRSLQSQRSKARARGKSEASKKSESDSSRGKSEASKKSESDSSKRQLMMETWQNRPAKVTQNDHQAENEDVLTSPKTSRGRQHSQHSQHLQNAINYLQKYVHSTGTDGDNVNVGLETIDEDPGPGNTIKQPKGRPILNKINKILADKNTVMNFRELEHVLRPVVVSCTLTLKKPTQVLSSITRNQTTNHCIGQNRMIETNHHTKIENCHTVIILSLRELLKNHVLNLTTMAIVNLEINVGTFILSNLTIISNIINRCTPFQPKLGPWWAL